MAEEKIAASEKADLLKGIYLKDGIISQEPLLGWLGWGWLTGIWSWWMSAAVQDLFIELIVVLDWLISGFFWALRNVWPSPEKVWDLWFKLGSHSKAKTKLGRAPSSPEELV